MMDTVEANSSSASSFQIEEVQLQFSLNSKICKLFVVYNFVHLILTNGVLYRIDLDSPENVISIKIKMSNDSTITNGWIDYKRYHLILKSSKNEYFYINYKQSKYHNLPKLKNLNITSILFFDEVVTENYTGPILVTTSNSLVLEYSISSCKETLVKTVMKNNYSVVSVVNQLLSNENMILKYVIDFVTSDNQIISLTTKIPSNPSPNISVFQSIAKAILIPLESPVHITEVSQNANMLAVRSDSKICLKDKNITENNLSIISEINVTQKIKSFLITGYFILVLTARNTLEVYNQLNYSYLASIPLTTFNTNIIGLSYDQKSKTYWLHSDLKIYEILIDTENTGIINSLVSINKFDEALENLNDENPQINQILKKKSYYLMENKNYKESIDTFLKTDESFDKVALLLFELFDKSLLRYYLRKKLNQLSKKEVAQKKLISCWIVESYVEELNSLENSFVNTGDVTKSVVDPLSSSSTINTKKNSAIDGLTLEFHAFMKENLKMFDTATVHQIIISHNRSEDLLYFAKLMGDHEFVIKYFLTHQKWEDALSTLSAQQKDYLIYNSATVLLINCPVKVVDAWMRLIDDIDPIKLMPALITYNKIIAIPQNIQPENNQAIRFLKFLIYEKYVQNRLIQNLFFSTLITYPNLADEDSILLYLEQYQLIKTSSFSKFSISDVSFDYDFILRLCYKSNKIKSAIFLYSMTEKYEEAVDLALQNDLIDNAIMVADKLITVDESRRKELWLDISGKLINKILVNPNYIKQNPDMFELEGEQSDVANVETSENNQIYQLLQFLTNKCGNLTIKDLLPLFPEFTVIDNFKDFLVEFLEVLANNMNKLSIEMEKTLEKSENINSKIAEFEAKSYQFVTPSDSCEICHKILIIRKFIIFPCTHAFHQDCLAKYILNSSNYKMRNAIYKLQKKITSKDHNHKIDANAKEQIDELLSTSCCLCSESKINEIDEPLIKSGDTEVDSWMI